MNRRRLLRRSSDYFQSASAPVAKRALQSSGGTTDGITSHWGYMLIGSCAGMLLIVLLSVCVIIKRRRKATSPLTPDPPKQAQLKCPSVQVNLTTLSQQPVTEPLFAPSPPQPVRIRAKGLLERRGSSASLTIELNPTDSSLPCSPPKESSAIEYLQSAGNRMSRKQLRASVKDPKSLHTEFLNIPDNHGVKLDIAGSSSQNRYKSIWPNEATRVRIWSNRGQNASDYINANYVRGYGQEPRCFIATQGPLANTIKDLWTMLWQERSPCVVMLTKLRERHKIKCEPYFPDKEAQYGPFHVTVRSVVQKNGYQVRDILINKTGESGPTHKISPPPAQPLKDSPPPSASTDSAMSPVEEATPLTPSWALKHYWFTAWPDHKAPASTSRQLLELIQEVEAERQRRISISNGTNVGPVTVHCSAGIGRTGCFVCTSIAMKQLQEENMVDLLGILCQTRLDRGGMVQTLEQYEFLHHCMIHFEKTLPETPSTGTEPRGSNSSQGTLTPVSTPPVF